MASPSSTTLLLLVLIFTTLNMVMSGDPDILTDFVTPPNAIPNATFFTYTGLRPLISGPAPTAFTVTKASLAEFPALNGQSVSYAVLQFPAGSVNPTHTHPRASELLFLIHGSLDVGFVDTTNKLFTQTLQSGDLFIFPKGLVHYQYNPDAQNPAIAISSFGSASAGTVSIPNGVFASGIDDDILAKSFKTDVATVQKLKAGLAAPHKA